MANEVYYCGKCDRQQQVNEGIKCKICGKTTVSWMDFEKIADVKLKWKRING
ncbi:MAG: hypothetical protein IPK08_11990 [Bacteroidetes bacterium]|nr:hypothetical protein [Bacteroidota bacterium]